MKENKISSTNLKTFWIDEGTRLSYESEELKVVLEGFALTSSDIKAVGIYTVAGQVYASIAKGFDGRETLGAVTQVMQEQGSMILDVAGNVEEGQFHAGELTLFFEKVTGDVVLAIVMKKGSEHKKIIFSQANRIANVIRDLLPTLTLWVPPQEEAITTPITVKPQPQAPPQPQPQQTPQIPPQPQPQAPPQPQPQEGYVPTWERVETGPSEAPSTSPAPSMGFSNPRMEMLNELQQKLARRRRMIEGLE